MAEAKEPWFVLERSEAMSAILLTHHAEVNVLSRLRGDDGVDLIVGVDGRHSPPSRLFVVRVKGTMSANPADWMPKVEPWFVGGGPFYEPTCVFVVDVRVNRVLYAWVAEPVAGPDGPTLVACHTPKFQELNEASVAEIVSRVKAYYDSKAKLLLTAG